MSDSEQRPLFDISGLKEKDAKDYIFSLTVHLKQTQAQVKQLEEEIDLWTGRIALAQEQGNENLKLQAEKKREELVNKKGLLILEIEEFKTGLEKLSRDLKLLPALERTIDPNALLEAMEQVAGPTDHVTPALKQSQAEEALAALKNKLRKG